ncbi:hypothetical protein B0H17DRAFT_1327163 [Mycena rosella]|uniref:Uncharacterized protein n=1 Tax=Mycena rosella TaxID=1033263 RepID=A0AAD7DYP6_MYCRO|nr:hypothetical protein B0H17DRAFT_1327163 [Mycena rosella]
MWFPQEQKTRRGTVFSPFWPPSATTLCAATFDVAPLLCESVDFQYKYAEDEVPDCPSDDEAPADELNSIDEESPHSCPRSRSPSCKRVQLQDVLLHVNHRHEKHHDKRQQATVKDGQVARAATLRKQLALSSKPIPSELDTTTLPTAHGAYSAKPEDKKERRGGNKRRLLIELVALGFRVVKWNGYDSRPIIDAKGRIIVVLAGQPNDPTYAASAGAAYAALQAEAAAAKFPRSLYQHCRGGSFAAFNVGSFYGKGTRAPISLDSGIYNGLFSRLLANAHINRMAVYASSVFALWAPRVYGHYHECDAKLRQHYPHLPRNFPKSVFSCAAFNFGPDVWTFRHRDGTNVPFGWCALVIEFPAGATILIPSATIVHSNIPVDVRNGEERASFTQYTPGALLRFIDNRFRTEADYASEDPEGYAKKCEEKSLRWETGLGMLSTADELFEPE